VSTARADARAGAGRRAVNGAALAFSLLTVIPLRARPDARGIAPAVAWFPIVGAAVGAIVGLVRVYASDLVGATVAAVLAAVVLVVVTGGLHQDGLADCADAIGVRGGRDRKLAVMREPTIGTFGTLALALWVALFVAVVAALPRHDALAALVVACALGRWAALAHGATAPPARADGLGATFAVPTAGLAVATAIVLAGGIALEGARGVVACASALAVALAVSLWARRVLGGRTGDTLGAAIVVAEIATCVVFVARV
jgi:adenosylcobinamide-GDP ribazoletransferase